MCRKTMTENRGEKTDGGVQRTKDTDGRFGALGVRDDDVENLSTVGDSRPCYEPDSILS